MPSNKNDNTLGKAQNLGTLSGSVSRRGVVGRKDKVDFFKFSVSGSSSFSATLTGLKDNIDLAVYDKSGNILAQSRKPGKKSEAIAGTLRAGTFYVQVKARTSSPSSRYRLSLSATAQPMGGSGVGGSGGSGSSGGSSGTGSGGGTTTRLVKISVSDSIVVAVPSGDTVFLYTKDISSPTLSAYRNGTVKELGTVDPLGSVVGGIKTYGNRVVWSSLLNNVGSELFFYDGTTTKQLTNSVSDTPRFLGMDGSRVFWLNQQPAGNQLYAYDGTQNVLLGTNVEDNRVFPGGFSQINYYKGLSSISAPVNTSLIWKAPGGSDGGSDTELFLFNGDISKVVQLTANDNSDDSLSSSTTQLLGVSTNFSTDNAFSNNNVVFEDSGNLNLYESTTGKITTLSPSGINGSAYGISGINGFAYAISGNNVLLENDNGTFIFNGSSIKKAPGNDQSTRMLGFSGSNLVFSKADGVTDTELFFYNATTEQTTQLTQRPGIDPPNLQNESLSHQDGANVFWTDSDSKLYISNGNTGDRKQLVDSPGELYFINSNVLWQKNGSLFFYNSSTGETNKLSDRLTNFFNNSRQNPWLSNSSVGFDTYSDGKTFLYNIATNTTTQLTDEGYSLIAISGSNALVTRKSDGAYFYTS